MLAEFLAAADLPLPHRRWEAIYEWAKRTNKAGGSRSGDEKRDWHRVILKMASSPADEEKRLLPSGFLVTADIYLWRWHNELALAAYWAGEKKRAKAAWERALAVAPEADRPQNSENINWCHEGSDSKTLDELRELVESALR